MEEVANFDPSLAKSGTFNTQQSQVGSKFIVFNESNIGLTLTFNDGETGYAPAGIAMIFEQPTPSPNVTWTQKNMLTGGGPISQVTVVSYAPNEPIIGIYPLNVEHQTYVGNTVNTAMGGSNTWQNDNNASGTQVGETTVAGSPGSNIIVQNQGLIEVLQWIGGVLTQIFKTDPGASSVVKLGNTGLLTEALGNMTVDQVLNVIGNTSLSSLVTSGAATLNSLSVTNGATVGGTLGVTGASTVSSLHATSNILEDNAIAVQWKDSGGTARTVMQVDSGNNVQIFGIIGNDKIQLLKHDGTLEITLDASTGNMLLAGGTIGKTASADILDASADDTYIKSRNAGSVLFQAPNGTNRASVTSGGLNLLSGTLSLLHGSIKGISFQSGTANATNVAHGLGATPDIVIIQYAGNFGTPPSQAAAPFNIGATTFDVHAQTGYSWTSMCIKQ